MNTAQPEEELDISINPEYKSYFKRVVFSFLGSFVIYFSPVFAIKFLIYGFTPGYLIAFALIGAFYLVYGFIKNRKVLAAISFSTAATSGAVSVQYLLFDKLITKTIDVAKLKIYVRQDFLTLFTPWVISIYENDQLIVKQKAIYYWRYNDLLQIEDAAKRYTKRKYVAAGQVWQ